MLDWQYCVDQVIVPQHLFVKLATTSLANSASSRNNLPLASVQLSWSTHALKSPTMISGPWHKSYISVVSQLHIHIFLFLRHSPHLHNGHCDPSTCYVSGQPHMLGTSCPEPHLLLCGFPYAPYSTSSAFTALPVAPLKGKSGFIWQSLLSHR